MKRWLWSFIAGLSLVLGIAVCVLWVRGRSGTDGLAWCYDRWLPDKSAASNRVYLQSDHLLWFEVNWGHVHPYDGQNVWGYYMNADLSGSRLQLRSWHEPYDGFAKWMFANGFDKCTSGASGFGPLRWFNITRTAGKDGADFRSVSIGVSHWLAALLLFVPPIVWFAQFCAACGLSRTCWWPRQFFPIGLFNRLSLEPR